jgi:PAS domain S-box-containing protein
VMDALSYALKNGGTLFLGNSESLGKFADLYDKLDARSRIYRRHSVSLRSIRAVQALPMRPKTVSYSEIAETAADRANDIQQLTQHTLMTDFTPACAVIDGNNQVVYIHGHTGPFLEPAIGRASMDILKMAREGLRTELSNAIREAAKKQSCKRFERLRVQGDDGMRLVNLSVQPLPGIGADSKILMVLFEDAGPIAAPGEGADAADVDEHKDAARVAWLEQELADTRETLQNANEELETSNEELQCTIEELQSSNEELMTSQEELSSINEELQTVNVELEDKVQQLEETSNDLENLLVSTEIGTVFLDLDLNVRRFTPAVLNVINLRETDVGRPLAEIVHKLDYDDLIADAEGVLDTLQPKVFDVRAKGDRWYSLRITLYRTGNNAIDGVVLTFVDLTERILAERRFLDLLEMTPDAMVISDQSGQIVMANNHTERLFGYSRGQLIGLPVEQLIPLRLRDLHGSVRRDYQRNPHTRAMGEADQQLIALRGDGREFPADIAIGPIHTPEGTLFVASVRDVTERHRTEAILTRTNKMFHEFCRWNQERYVTDLSPLASLQALSRRLVEQVGYAQCWIALTDGATHQLAIAAQSGIPPQTLASLDPELLNPGDGREPRVTRDIQQTDTSPALRALATAWGCNSLLAAPMVAGEQQVGVLAITTLERDGFPPLEVQLWKTLSTSLAVMLASSPAGDDATELS